MKQIIGWIGRPFRKAVMGRFDARIVHLVGVAFETRMIPTLRVDQASSEVRLDRIERLLEKAERSNSRLLEEVDLVLNGLTREIFRLQAQVDSLRRDLGRERASGSGGLSILSESSSDPSPGERSRVG